MSEDEDDEVVTRIPVQLRRAREDAPLSLFQYPLRPHWRPYDTTEASLQSARVRPVHNQVELKLRPETGSSTFDSDVVDSPLTHVTLASTVTPPKTSYAVGMLTSTDEGHVLTLTPLGSCLQLRPSFAQIDEVEAEANKASSRGGADASSSGAHAGDHSEAPTSFTPVFRAAQTEKEIEARRNSHAYMIEQQEAEEWSSAKLRGAESDESKAVREAIFGVPGAC